MRRANATARYDVVCLKSPRYWWQPRYRSHSENQDGTMLRPPIAIFPRRDQFKGPDRASKDMRTSGRLRPLLPGTSGEDHVTIVEHGSEPPPQASDLINETT